VSLTLISDSDSDGEIRVISRPNPPPKRRRIIDPSEITSVPIYSNKVNSSLQLKPAIFKQLDCGESDEEEAKLWSPSPPKSKPFRINLSDSEDEPDGDESKQRNQNKKHDVLRSPSPPPPPRSPPVKRTKRADKKIKEVNRILEEIGSLVCPSPERAYDVPEQSDCLSPRNDDDDDDDIIIISSEDKQKRRPHKPVPRASGRQISLKFRWRTDVYKIPVLSTDPLSKAVDLLSAKLNVLPSQILLLRQDTELPVHSTPTELDLGIADIIDCVVVIEDKEEGSNSCDLITVRLQGNEKGSAQEYSLAKDAPLGSILTQYTSGLSATAKRKVKFLFDGSKVTPNQTPSQLDMENGDVIEVWT
ncbi:hypothetical protein NFI96_020305, partial [Prochilodus magdalenae]